MRETMRARMLRYRALGLQSSKEDEVAPGRWRGKVKGCSGDSNGSSELGPVALNTKMKEQLLARIRVNVNIFKYVGRCFRLRVLRNIIKRCS